jgi:hypothetical protein
MTLYNDVLFDLQYYILNEDNIKNSLKMKIKPITTVKDKSLTNQISRKVKDKNSIFIPYEQDKLFWCFYILKNGHSNYETLYSKNDVIARQIKIEYIDIIRKNKQIVKTYKFDTISNIENNLANEKNLNVKTFLTLCAIENINVLFINKKTCYELFMNDTETVFIVSALNNNNNNNNGDSKSYLIRYGFETTSINNAKNVADTLYKIDNIEKPIKAISSYKVSDLIEICDKLAIDIKNSQNSKTKTKKELYDSIIQHF